MHPYGERAVRDGVPARAVRRQCRNWGVPAGRADEIADEAAAEAVARSLARAFDTEDAFRAWVTRVALNLAADALRRGNRARPLAADAPAAPPRAVRPDLDGILTRVSCETQRSILRMTYEGGLTLDEIAARLAPPGGSPNAGRLWVKRRRDAALAALRDALARDGWSGRGPP